MMAKLNAAIKAKGKPSPYKTISFLFQPNYTENAIYFTEPDHDYQDGDAMQTFVLHSKYCNELNALKIYKDSSFDRDQAIHR